MASDELAVVVAAHEEAERIAATVAALRRAFPRAAIWVGDEVVEGDTLVILESMKMEIPVVVEAPGVVTEISVAAGDVIREGDVIAILI